jgi:TonB-dependent starch-binding outer membrane protein SusC
MKKPMRKSLLLISILLASVTYAQFSIRGIVLDSETNDPLIGVNIVIKETNVGTISDHNGNFYIQASEGDIILFRYLGYATYEHTVDKNTNLVIKLINESVTLQEVVAVGYGVVRKRDLTGSVSSVRGEKLSRLQAPNIASALVGQSAGVMVTSPTGEGPGSSPTIIIRGENSIQGSNNPLWVIDGFTRAGGANTVNPEDIESIEILKDASATAIYGSRGAGGVIIVTTKKGARNTKPIIELKVTSGVQKVTNELNLMNGQEYYDYWRNSAINNYFDSAVDSIANYDWRNQVIRDAWQQDYFLSLYGGSESLIYKITANYFDQDGVIKYNNDYKRFGVRSFFDIKINQHVKAGLTTYFERDWRNRGAAGSTYQQAVEMSPLIPVFSADGRFNRNLNPRDLSVESSNFIENIKDNVNKQESNTTNLQGYIEVEPIKGLRIKSMASLNYSTGKEQRFSPKHLDIINQLNNANANQSQANSYEWVNIISLVKDFDKQHSVNAVVGMTVEKSERYTVGAWGQDFPIDRFEYWAIGSGPSYELTSLNYPITAFSPGMIMLRNSGYSSYSEHALMSFLARVNYTYQDKYLFTFTGRYDGASQLATGHKWAMFPSAAIGWRVSEEEYIKNLGLFQNFRVRLSWGRTGSQGVSPYSTLGLASLGNYVLGDDGKFAPVYAYNSLPNPTLTWEKTDQTNIGLDLGFFDNRFRISADYYHKNTFDMFVTKNLPAETGFGSYLSNDGAMENKGVEFDISGDIISKSDFSLASGIVLGLNRNRIMYLGGDDYKLYTNKNSYGGLLSYNFVGQPVSVIHGWVYDGIWQKEEDILYGAVDVEAGASQTKPGDMRYKDINNDGKIDVLDKVQILNPHPKFSASWNGNLRYKSLSFSWLFSGIFGHQIYNYTKKQLFNQLSFRTNYWTPESGIQNQPSAGNENVKDSDYFVEDGSFVKLRNLTIGYMFPKEIASRLNIRSMEVYLSGKDLLTITGYSGYNPEVSRSGFSESFRGVDYNSYPATFSVFAGIKVMF